MARNRYPGICYRCKQHAECAIKYRGTDFGKEELVKQVKSKLAELKESNP